MIILILLVAVGLSIVMALAWAFQRRVGNAGWVDVFWTFGLGLAGVAVALAPMPGTAGPTGRQALIALMAAVWSIRLGTHLGVRVAHHAEDVRYNDFRRSWGADFQRRMFWFLQIQAAAAILLALCILLAARHPAAGIRLADWVGVLILAVAIGGEGIADAQLKRFKANPANKGGVCDVGLWGWSRHPNYFFEWLVWAAYAVMAVDFSGGYLWGWAALLGPIAMYWLLVYVSGIPPLETLMLKSRGDAYRRYQAATHAFFPLPPRRHELHPSENGPAMTMMSSAINAFERLPLPDAVTAAGITFLCDRTRRSLTSYEQAQDVVFLDEMRQRPVAEHTDAANVQHYEIPPEFFSHILGPRRKYSCCLYQNKGDTLAMAEEHALADTTRHADLADGQEILELGCGWGSLSLWMAEHFPKARITAVSNSHGQRGYIEGEAAKRGFKNLKIITADMNAFSPTGSFDRVVSVEMFEHMANWQPLLERVRAALKPEGRLFLHVFSHKTAPYRFDRENKADWIAQHFFTGGIMPSHGLIRHFDSLFTVEAEWLWNGVHYQRTALDWLANYDRNAAAIAAILQDVYGADWALWRRRWRLFFLATAGLFGNSNGTEWGVSHYRLAPVG